MKPTLIFLHGFFQDSRIFKKVLDPLQNTYQIEVPDLPGFGDNIQNITEQSFFVENQVQWLKNYLSLKKASPLFVVGYSMGARLLLQSLHEIQVYVNGIIIESGTNGIESELEKAERKRIDFENANLLRTNKELFIEKWSQHPTLKPYKTFSSELNEILKKVQFEQNEHYAALSLLHFGTGSMPYLDSTYFEKITKPILFLAGEKDTKFAKKAVELSNYNARFNFHLVENCGHRIHLEKTDQYFQCIKEFIYAHQS